MMLTINLISEEEFNEGLGEYLETLKGIEIPRNPTPDEMVEYQANLDYIRTEILSEYAIVQGTFLALEFEYKNRKEMLFGITKKSLIDGGIPKPTVNEIESAVSRRLAKEEYTNGISYSDLLSSYIYREASLKVCASIAKGKQDSIHAPNNLVKLEGRM